MDSMNDNGYAMVYYVHDADGETVLFDKRFKQHLNMIQNTTVHTIRKRLF